jgi:hypothetical protein
MNTLAPAPSTAAALRAIMSSFEFDSAANRPARAIRTFGSRRPATSHKSKIQKRKS